MPLCCDCLITTGSLWIEQIITVQIQHFLQHFSCSHQTCFRESFDCRTNYNIDCILVCVWPGPTMTLTMCLLCSVLGDLISFMFAVMTLLQICYEAKPKMAVIINWKKHQDSPEEMRFCLLTFQLCYGLQPFVLHICRYMEEKSTPSRRNLPVKIRFS